MKRFTPTQNECCQLLVPIGRDPVGLAGPAVGDHEQALLKPVGRVEALLYATLCFLGAPFGLVNSWTSQKGIQGEERHRKSTNLIGQAPNLKRKYGYLLSRARECG